MNMEKNILLTGTLATYTYYAGEVDRDPRFRAILKTPVREALRFADSGEARIDAVVTTLFGSHGNELKNEETGNCEFTGAAVIRRIRKKWPNARFFLIGANPRNHQEIAEYSGETADIVFMDPEHAVNPVDLVEKLEECLLDHSCV